MTFIASFLKAVIAAMFATVAHIVVGTLLQSGPLLDPSGLYVGVLIGAMAFQPWSTPQ